MISVVIPNWNGKKFLPLCLDSLRSQVYRDFEVILADNGSTDGSCGLVSEKYPEVNLIALPENRGFSAAVNEGIKASRGDLIALFNNDAEAHPDWLRILSEKSGEYPDADFFACKVLLYHHRDILDSAGVKFCSDGRFILRGNLEPDGEEYSREERVFGGHGACVLYRKSLMEDVGGFDEDFFSYLEEADMNIRINLRGHYGMYIPDAVVYHVGSGTNLKTQFGKDGVRVAGEMSFDKPTQYGKKVSDFIAYHTLRNRWFLMVKDFSGDFILRSLPSVILLELSQFMRWVIVEKRWKIYYKAFMDFLKKFSLMIGKRKEIMKSRRITTKELLDRAEKTGFFERLSGLIRRAGK